MKCKRLLSFVMAGLILSSSVGEVAVTYAADGTQPQVETQAGSEPTDKPADGAKDVTDKTGPEADAETPEQEQSGNGTESLDKEDAGAAENADTEKPEKSEDPEKSDEEKAKELADSIIGSIEKKEYKEAADMLWKGEQPLAALDLLKDEQRTSMYENLEDADIYLVKNRLKYDFADSMIELKEVEELKKEDQDFLDEMLSLYNEVPSVKLSEEDTKKADEVLLNVLNDLYGSEDKEFADFDNFTDDLQANTDLDVTKVLTLMQSLWDSPSDRIEAKTKEVKAYLYSVYGFDQPVEKPEEETEKPDTDAEKPGKDDAQKPETPDKDDPSNTEKPGTETPDKEQDGSEKPETPDKDTESDQEADKDGETAEKPDKDNADKPADGGVSDAPEGDDTDKPAVPEEQKEEAGKPAEKPEAEEPEKVEETPVQKAAKKADKLILEVDEIDFEKVMELLLSTGNFYEVYSALDENAQLKLPAIVSSHDVHVLEMVARYSMVDVLISFQQKRDSLTEEDMKVLSSYIDLYRTFSSKTFTSYLTQTEKRTSKEAALSYLTLHLDKENRDNIKDLDAYAAYLQTLTDLDVNAVYTELYKIVDPKIANTEKSAKEFKVYVCNLFGFDAVKLGLVAEEETKEEKEQKNQEAEFDDGLTLKEISEQYQLVEDYFKAAPDLEKALKGLSAKEAYQAMLLVRYESVKRFYVDTDLTIYFKLIERYKKLASEKDDLETWEAEAVEYTDEYGEKFGFLNLCKVNDFESYKDFLKERLDKIDGEKYFDILLMFFDAETEEEWDIAKKVLNDYKGELFGNSFRAARNTGIRDGSSYDIYYSTLNEATSKVANGGSILLSQNRYLTGQWNIPNGKHVTIMPEGNYDITLTCAVPYENRVDHNIYIGEETNVSFLPNPYNGIKFHFDGGWNQLASQDTSAIIYSAGKLTLDNVEVYHSNNLGVLSGMTGSLTVKNSDFHNCVNSGIMTANAAYVYNTKSHNNSHDGITVMAHQTSGGQLSVTLDYFSGYENGRAGIAFGANGGSAWSGQNAYINNSYSYSNGCGLYTNALDGDAWWDVRFHSGSIYSNGGYFSTGGGVYNKKGAVRLSGGSVYSNWASYGSGVYVGDTLYMNGDGNVNTNNDIYLPAGRHIYVDGYLNYGTAGRITPDSYWNGRQVVKVIYGSWLGSMALSRFQLTPNSSWGLYAGDQMNGMSNEFVVISKSNILDVNGNLNGTINGNTTGWLTFDVYINGGLVANDVSDYYTAHPMGTTYRVTDVKAVNGKRYMGVTSGSASGTINSTTGVDLKAVTLLNVNYYSNGGVWTGTNSGNSLAGANQYITSFAFPYDVTDSHYNYSTFGLTKTGYQGTGYWGTSTSGGNLVQQDENLTGGQMAQKHGVNIASESKTINVYAQWNPNVVSIAYNPNGGTVNAANTGYNQYGWITVGGETYFHKIKYGESSDPYNASTFGLTKPGYRFVGWRLEPGTEVLNQDTVYPSTKYNHHTNAGSNTSNMYNVTCYLYAVWEPITYTNNLSHWMFGFVNGEGNNDYKNAFNIGYSSFQANMDSTFALSADRALRIPNGFYLSEVGTSSITGSWQNLPVGTKVTQQAKSMSFQYNYHPHTYSIAYNLNGGKLAAPNPSSYNVLYGINTLNNPTRIGYKFEGWYLGDKKVTGINAGKNAVFGSIDGMYADLATRTTGNLTLNAKMTPIKYTVIYDGNGATGGSTPSTNVEYDQTWKVPENGFKKGPFEFIEWNTKPDGSGTSYKPGTPVVNLTSKDGDQITFYAIWEEEMKVTYAGNGATSGTQKTEVVTEETLDSQYNYTVRKNKGYTGYARTKHTFDGWNKKEDAIRRGDFNNLKDENTNKISWTVLQDIADEQAKAAGKTAGVPMSFRAVGFSGLANAKAAREMKTATMYAQWDEAPTLTVDDGKNTRTFYEGWEVTEEDLLKGVSATDTEDAMKGLDLDIKVVKIEYAAGKLVDGEAQPAYGLGYTDGMQADDKLDTWFLEMQKDAKVCHKVTYQVTDSGGNTVQAVGNVYVQYNEAPKITAEDRYFTLEEAQAGMITEEVLLHDQLTSKEIKVSDKEEGNFTTPGVGPKKVDLLDFDAGEFTSFTESGYRRISIHTQDSYGPGGKGKETVKQITVYVVKDGVIPNVNEAKEVRFIDEENYNKNKDVDPSTLSEAEKEVRNQNGGLNVDSVWYHDPAYRSEIEGTFDKVDGDSYYFTEAEADEVREYVDEHGIGNMKEEDALSNFADQFLN